jgi:hypothetical protein
MTQVLLGAETIVLVLLVVLVAGLLRSHAEILRRLGPVAETDNSVDMIPPPLRRAGSVAPAIAGTTLSGDAVAVSFDAGGRTLLAFLSSGCATCDEFWAGLDAHPLPSGARAVAVTKGPERESPSRLADVAPARTPVIMSSQAWRDYAVPGSPYFVLVDGDVKGEGTASSWSALARMLADAGGDRAAMPAVDGDRIDGDRIDARFAAAGILPGDPSLYPAGR